MKIVFGTGMNKELEIDPNTTYINVMTDAFEIGKPYLFSAHFSVYGGELIIDDAKCVLMPSEDLLSEGVFQNG